MPEDLSWAADDAAIDLMNSVDEQYSIINSFRNQMTDEKTTPQFQTNEKREQLVERLKIGLAVITLIGLRVNANVPISTSPALIALFKKKQAAVESAFIQLIKKAQDMGLVKRKDTRSWPSTAIFLFIGLSLLAVAVGIGIAALTGHSLMPALFAKGVISLSLVVSLMCLRGAYKAVSVGIMAKPLSDITNTPLS